MGGNSWAHQRGMSGAGLIGVILRYLTNERRLPLPLLHYPNRWQDVIRRLTPFGAEKESQVGTPRPNEKVPLATSATAYNNRGLPKIAPRYH